MNTGINFPFFIILFMIRVLLKTGMSFSFLLNYNLTLRTFLFLMLDFKKNWRELLSAKGVMDRDLSGTFSP